MCAKNNSDRYTTHIHLKCDKNAQVEVRTGGGGGGRGSIGFGGQFLILEITFFLL